jgi:chemotaxis signal transduction protein
MESGAFLVVGGSGTVVATADKDFSLLAFRVGDLRCALDFGMVLHVGPVGEVTAPGDGHPSYFVGSLARPGEGFDRTLLVDLRRRFGDVSAEIVSTCQVVVIASPGAQLGFVVDEDLGIVSVRAGDTIYKASADVSESHGKVDLCGVVRDQKIGEVYILCPRSALGELYRLTGHGGCGGCC